MPLVGSAVERVLVRPDKYEGEMKDGKPHGRGVAVWADGNRYEGDWQDGKPNGSGTLQTRYWQYFSGYWTNGCLIEGKRWVTIGTSEEACGSY